MQSKKIIFTIILSIIFVLLLSTKIFAIEINGTTYPDFPSDVNNRNYYLLLQNGNRVELYSCDVPITIGSREGAAGGYSIMSSDTSYNLYYYDLYNNNWRYRVDYLGNDGSQYNPSNIITSSFNTYDFDNNLVFQLPPQEQEQESQTIILAPIVEEIQLRITLQEILGLLPVILSVLVSLVAFYKGLAILLTFLRKS